MKRFSNLEDLYPLKTPENDNSVKKESDAPTPTQRIASEEVKAQPMGNTQKYDSKSALESLKARMNLSFGNLENKPSDNTPKTFNPQKLNNDSKTAVKTEQKPTVKFESEPAKVSQPTFARTVRPEIVRNTATNNAQNKDLEQKSLLEKCKPFVTDESGHDLSNAIPIYKLESVADILEGKRKDTLSRLAQQYDISNEDLGKITKKEPKPEIEKISPQTAKTTQTQQAKPQSAFKTQTSEPTPTKPKSTPIKKEPISTKDKEIIEINAFFENVQSSVPLSTTENNATASKPVEKAENMTVTFTPVNIGQSEKPKIMVSSNTQNIDLTGEIMAIKDVNSYTKNETVTLEKDEFEEYTPKNEIKTEKDLKVYIRKFSIKKRKSFLSVTFSVLLTLTLAFMKLPFMAGVILGETKVAMTVCTVLAAIIVIINGSMFASIAKIFGKNSSADIAPALASLSVLAYSVMGIKSGEIVLDMLVLLGFILTVRALGKFRKASYMLSNLKQIAVSTPKNAVRLIDDNAVTFAMAKNSIEGDTLIAAPQKCTRIGDFLKYSTYGTILNGKMPLITILTIIFATISGLAATSYYAGSIYGFYSAAAVLCFASVPSLFFINDFPLYSAAKKLNKKGGMIAGLMGASHIDMANAVLLNSSDIFPAGTVTLHQMKILSDNSLDETILRAASLTQSLNSPLAPIFKKIAGESNISTLPNSDTIKYEERMGISGWVDNKPLFIGNRTLMEAHGITVPDVELDRKILRNGFFPIYLATEGRACALLMVQYSVNPAVAHELRQLTKLGVTILVNNTDPNITDQMICDYLGLYSDSVMIMSNAGYQMFKNTASPQESCSAPACFRGKNIMIAKIINCANKVKRSNTLLCVLYILALILGVVIFAYSSFAGSGILINSGAILLYSFITTIVTYILYLFLKP